MTGNGNWSTDENWLQCDKSCGFGQRMSSRTCTNPSPMNGGRFCEGSSFVVEPCNEFHCPSKLMFHNIFTKL